MWAIFLPGVDQMKCRYCASVITSDKIFRIHEAACKKAAAENKELAPDKLPDDLTKLTVQELKALCKARNIKNYSRLKEAELIALIEVN